ncbi:TPR domain-containing glycosyltransferase [Desulfolucanica intricata]|uniref:TPR domain-containing glycosyltransferase n=1 Tax=Desulfolucanica intricata TaxID=1285191 RepID=UPI00082BB08D|nr:TPR domain-containing glycosyltransferase [Desulfolucanica intricata]
MTAKISLCMIVRNEAGNLRRCLASVTGAVDEIIIVDTGSTDNTREIALEFGAQVHSFPWNENFSDARNTSLEMATGDWILFLDADEELAPASKEALKKRVNNEHFEGYFIKVINYLGNEGWTETCPDLIFRLFRNRKHYRFHGAIHEQIVDVILKENKEASLQIAEEIIIYHYGYLDRQIHEKNKKIRNLKIIQRELEQTPDNQLLRYHYGVELYRAEKFGEAAEELTRAANNIDPNTIYFPKLLRYIVMSYQSAGQQEKAIDAALQGLQFFPNYADIYYYAGLSYLELKQYTKAGEAFQKAISMPEQPAQYASFNGVRGFRAYFHLGQIAEIFMNYETALKYYISSLQDNPNFTHSLECIVRILKPRENPDYTQECLKKVFDFCTPQANLLIGEIYFRQGAYQLALNHLEQCIENGLTSPEIQLWQAICLIQQQRYLEALRIIESFPPDSRIYPLAKFNKLFCFWLQGQKKKVYNFLTDLRVLGLAEDTEKVLTLLFELMDKRKKPLRVLLGQDGLALVLDIIQRLLDMNDIERVLALLKSISPESLESQSLSIAQLFFDYGYKDNAKIFLQKFLSNNRNAEAHNLMAEICQANGNYIEAEHHYRYALEFNPENPGYYIKLINLYKNRYKQILKEAAKIHPDIVTYHQLTEED